MVPINNSLANYIYICVCVCVCLNRIWHLITRKRWYAINTTKPKISGKKNQRRSLTFNRYFIPWKINVSYLFKLQNFNRYIERLSKLVSQLSQLMIQLVMAIKREFETIQVHMTCRVMLLNAISSKEIKSVTWVPILDEDVCILLRAHVLGKGMNPSVPPPPLFAGSRVGKQPKRMKSLYLK